MARHSHRPKSKSAVVGGVVAVVVALAILGASFGLAAIGDNGTDDSDRSAASSYSRDTKVSLIVKNSLPAGVTVDAVADASGWTGLKPTDTAAFADRKLAAGASHSADLVFATTRSRMPFTLTFRSEAGAELGSVNIDRDYLKETCTSVTQGKYTTTNCTQVNVWWFAPSSTFTESRILGTASSCPSSNNSVDLAEYTDEDGKKQRVKFTLTCSSATGATTGTLAQTAIAGS